MGNFSFFTIIVLCSSLLAELKPQHMTNRLQIDLAGNGAVENEKFSFYFDLSPADDVPAIVMKSCEK